MIPPADEVLHFIAACAERKLPFKATAGLHHAARGAYPLTYEPDAVCGSMHGFLNLFLAAGALYFGVEPAIAASIFDQPDANAFQFTDAGVSWKGFSLSAAQIADFRSNFATAFGSCSFEEPVADLHALKFL